MLMMLADRYFMKQSCNITAQSVSGPSFREQQFSCVRRSPCDKALDTNTALDYMTLVLS